MRVMDDQFSDKFEIDEDGFEYGMTKSQLGSAISIWSSVREGDKSATVQNAADAFRVSERLVRECVEDHPWALIAAGDVIENDGM